MIQASDCGALRRALAFASDGCRMARAVLAVAVQGAAAAGRTGIPRVPWRRSIFPIRARAHARRTLAHFPRETSQSSRVGVRLPPCGIVRGTASVPPPHHTQSRWGVFLLCGGADNVVVDEKDSIAGASPPPFLQNYARRSQARGTAV